jgi:hypothetical protein
MAEAAVVDAFRARLGGWPGLAECPLVESNTSGRTAGTASAFLQLQFPFATSERASFGAPGANVWREEGAARILVNARRGTGTAQALAWASDLARFFRGKHFDGVETFGPSTASTDDSNENGAYYVVAVAIPYRFDLTG